MVWKFSCLETGKGDWFGWNKSSGMEVHNQILKKAGLCRYEEGDHITWVGKMRSNKVVVANTYKYLIHTLCALNHTCWFYKVWKLDVPIKIILYVWLVWWNKSLTWENLSKCSLNGHRRCPLCRDSIKTNLHLFLECPIAILVWDCIFSSLNMSCRRFVHIEECIQWWIARGGKFQATPHYIFWEIWRTRNGQIFEGL